MKEGRKEKQSKPPLYISLCLSPPSWLVHTAAGSFFSWAVCRDFDFLSSPVQSNPSSPLWPHAEVTHAYVIHSRDSLLVRSSDPWADARAGRRLPLALVPSQPAALLNSRLGDDAHVGVGLGDGVGVLAQDVQGLGRLDHHLCVCVRGVQRGFESLIIIASLLPSLARVPWRRRNRC